MSEMNEMNALAEAAAAASKRESEATAAAPPRKRRKADLPREERLAASRFAAAESRKRKREMVEDLQASVAFFSRSNASMKMHNAELERQILLAKQRIARGENGPALGADSSVLGLLNPPGREDEQAQAAHFAATQAMYKSMGYPPAAAREAAATFAAAYKGKDRAYAAAPRNNSVGLSLSTSPDEDQAQAAHFTATQALYKSMGFPPRAAKEAATSFSQVHSTFKAPPEANLKPAAVNLDVKPAAVARPASKPAAQPETPLSSSLQALNQYVMRKQQQAQAQQQKAAAAASLAAMLSVARQPAAPALTSLAQPFLFSGVPSNGNGTNRALLDLIAKLCQNQRK